MSEMTDLPCEIVSDTGYGPVICVFNLINCYLNEIKREVLILRHHLDAHFMVKIFFLKSRKILSQPFRDLSSQTPYMTL